LLRDRQSNFSNSAWPKWETRILQYKDQAVRIYIFKSETTKGLRAFAGDPAGIKLPEKHGPWSVTGVVADNKAPPHKLSREVIEQAIADEGFQLWRLSKKAEAIA
jgi:hypothetical protein